MPESKSHRSTASRTCVTCFDISHCTGGCCIYRAHAATTWSRVGLSDGTKLIRKLGPEAILIAWDLRAGFVSSSMNKLNILGNSIGDEGYEMLMKLAEEKGMLTFCGFEEGQTEADLSKKNLGPVDAKLIARELTTGYVSTSMTSLK